MAGAVKPGVTEVNLSLKTQYRIAAKEANVHPELCLFLLHLKVKDVHKLIDV